MNELQVFSNPKFGEVRTVAENGRVLFCGSDVARALGYARPNEAVSAHAKGTVKRRTLTRGGEQDMLFITEGDIYRLATHSKLPGAEEFESWVFDEVLPAIRKHGAYVTDKAKQQALEAKLLNARARVSAQWMKISQQVNSPEYKQICASYASNALAGEPVLPLPAAQERYYSATEIGKELGISAQKVGSLAIANGLKTDEFGKWFFDKSKYSSKEVTTFRYNDKAVERLRELAKG